MTKLEFIARQLSKAEKKNYEHYVVSRIWHLLNDTDLKLITQQYVIRQEGRALTDMYFPQLDLHVEVDEPYHLTQLDQDRLREEDIVNATEHQVRRLSLSSERPGELLATIERVNDRIDKLVTEINAIKASKVARGNFRPWVMEDEYDPKTYIRLGYIDIRDNVAFPTMVRAASCFGRTYKPKSIWSGGTRHWADPGKIIWFPKLYPNGDWNNWISDDRTEIRERCLNDERAANHIADALRDRDVHRVVFARVRGPLGDVLYRFRGLYQLDADQTQQEATAIYRRIATRVPTYPAQP